MCMFSDVKKKNLGINLVTKQFYYYRKNFFLGTRNFFEQLEKVLVSRKNVSVQNTFS